LLKENTVRDILDSILEKPLSLFSFKMVSQNNHSLIEISLDNLDHPYGSVTIGDCERISRKLAQVLEEEYAEENYTLQVSSAGAERELKIPFDLERFKSVPIKLIYRESDEKWKEGVFLLVRLEDGKVELQPYKAKSSKKKPVENLILDISVIKKGHLYLDF
jgi:ribosome maturation factor RimP